MIAGASAGVMEHLCMFPVDTIKTHLQALPKVGSQSRSFGSAVSSLVRREGFFRLYNGVSPIVAAAIPSHAIYFAVYEEVKERLGGNEAGYHPLAHGAAGGVATMAHDAVVTPLDVVKQNMQLSDQRIGVLKTIRHIFRVDGARAFYQSYPTTLLLNVPFQAVHFATYETLKTFFSAGEQHTFREEGLAGGCAGALGGFVSTPLDVVKTRIQTQDTLSQGGVRFGPREIIESIWKTEGVKGFMKGASARILYFMPSAAICWTTYETMKKVLHASPEEDDKYEAATYPR